MERNEVHPSPEAWFKLTWLRLSSSYCGESWRIMRTQLSALLLKCSASSHLISDKIWFFQLCRYYVLHFGRKRMQYIRIELRMRGSALTLNLVLTCYDECTRISNLAKYRTAFCGFSVLALQFMFGLWLNVKILWGLLIMASVSAALLYKSSFFLLWTWRVATACCSWSVNVHSLLCMLVNLQIDW